MASKVLTTEQAARVAEVAPDTLRRHIRKGNLPARKAGRDWRVTEAAALKFKRTKPRAGAPVGNRYAAKEHKNGGAADAENS